MRRSPGAIRTSFLPAAAVILVVAGVGAAQQVGGGSSSRGGTGVVAGGSSSRRPSGSNVGVSTGTRPSSVSPIEALEARTRGDGASDDEVWGDLGDAYENENRHTDAKRAYRIAFELDPTDDEWIVKLVMIDRTEISFVIRILQEYTQGEGAGQAEAWGVLGDALRLARRDGEALTAYRKARDLEPNVTEWNAKIRNLEAPPARRGLGG